MTTRHLPILILTIAATACSGAPGPSVDNLADDATWRALDAEMAAHFERSELPDRLDLSLEALRAALQLKRDGYEKIRSAFVETYSTNDLDRRAAATLRVAQLDLNLACDLIVMEAPSSFDEGEAELLNALITEQTQPILNRAASNLKRASNMGESSFSAAAGELRRAFPDRAEPVAARRFCESRRSAWYREPQRDFETRMRAACGAGEALGCFVASQTTSADDADELARRACESGVQPACIAANATNADAPSPTLRGTCEEGNALECWRLAARLDAGSLREYTDACFGGSGFDCMKRGLLLEETDSLLTACTTGSVPQRSSIDDARAACDAGEAAGCFQLGVRTYVRPRELERAADTTIPVGETGEGIFARTTSGGEDLRKELIVACIDERAVACRELALTYEADSSDRVRYMDRGCRLGDPKACWAWGSALLENPDNPDDEQKEAIGALERACSEGVDPACVRLANSFGRGENVPSSRVCAARFLFEACSAEDPFHCLRFDELIGASKSEK